MNEKIKNIFASIGAGIVAFFACILGVFIYHNGKSDDRVEADIDRLSESADKLRTDNEGLAKTNGRLSDLIEDIEKTRHNN